MQSDLDEKLKEAKRLSILAIVPKVVLDFVFISLVSCFSIDILFLA